MSDLTDRLRHAASYRRPGNIFDAAADEIDRLTAELGDLPEAQADLMAGNKVLRDALTRLVGDIDRAPGFARSHIELWFPRAMAYARAALIKANPKA